MIIPLEQHSSATIASPTVLIPQLIKRRRKKLVTRLLTTTRIQTWIFWTLGRLIFLQLCGLNCTNLTRSSSSLKRVTYVWQRNIEGHPRVFDITSTVLASTLVHSRELSENDRHSIIENVTSLNFSSCLQPIDSDSGMAVILPLELWRYAFQSQTVIYQCSYSCSIRWCSYDNRIECARSRESSD